MSAVSKRGQMASERSSKALQKSVKSPAQTRMASQRRAQLAKIHIGKKDLGLDDDTYRDVLESVTGRRSAGDLNYQQLNAVIDAFKSKGWNPVKRKRGGKRYRKTHNDAEVRMVYALWTAMREEKIVKAQTPDGFVKRMTGVENTEWLKPEDARVVIEALKKMRARGSQAE